MRRLSPKEPCPVCNGRAWTFNEQLFRWECDECLEHPGTKIVKDFEGWYRSVNDDWGSITRAIAELDAEPRPDSIKDQLIREARRVKLEEEYKHADAAAMVASALRLLADWTPHGSFTVNLPDYEIEVQHEW